MRRLLPLLLIPLLLNGCLRYYTGYPKDKVAKAPVKQYEKLRFRIKPYPKVMDSGPRGLERAFRSNAPFRETAKVEDAPKDGLFVDVEVKWREPGLFSLIFIYVSAVTYTIIPQWSTKEKYTLVFDLYKDGAFLKSYQYEAGRKGFMWLPLVLATWYTATSPDQDEVFESMVFQFYEDAAPHFASETAPAGH
jgi:hypothetical protein